MSKRTNKGRRRKGLPKLAPNFGRIEGPLGFMEKELRKFLVRDTDDPAKKKWFQTTFRSLVREGKIGRPFHIGGPIQIYQGTTSEKLDVTIGDEAVVVVDANSVIPVADVVPAIYAYVPATPMVLVAKAEGAFRWLNVLFLDKSVVDEQVGDAMEVINKIVHESNSRRKSLAVWLKIITTYVWVVVNSVRSKFRERFGKKTKG